MASSDDARFRRTASQVACSRRTLLLGSLGGIIPLAGCQGLFPETRSAIDLKLSNYTDRAQPVKLTLLREDENGSDEPVVLEKEYTVPAPETASDAAGTVHERNVVPRRRYLVRVQLKYGGFDRSHAHFYPADSDADVIDIRIRRNEQNEELFVDYRFL